MNPSNQLTGVFLETDYSKQLAQCGGPCFLLLLYVNTSRSGESISHWTIDHLSTKSVICHERKGMKGKARSPGGFDALLPQGLLFHRTKKERKDESSETSLCDLYNLPGKLNLAGHINWSHFRDSFPCKNIGDWDSFDASVAAWKKNSRSFTALCFQIKIWIWKMKKIERSKFWKIHVAQH